MPDLRNERPERTDASGRSRIGITMGDPAGIGPEVVIKAVADPGIREDLRPVIIGDLRYLRSACSSLKIETNLVPFEEPFAPTGAPVVEVFDLMNLEPGLAVGEESEQAGRAAAEYIETAVAMWQSGKIDAIATAPINKRSLQLGGRDFPGHTEFLAALTDTREFAMSFFAEDLRVVLLSTHIPLREAIETITAGRMASLIEFTDRSLSSLLCRPIKIAVAGLNPHASEGGLFGTEEAEHIVPAIERSRDRGIDVTGPYPPDTVFLRGFRREFDAVIACYHDQATIAVKSLSFGSAVNVTLGLPMIRTSVDHGTAFDIAGKGIADESSMKAAIRLAARLASTRRRVTGVVN